MAAMVTALKEAVNVSKGGNSMQTYIADVQRKCRSLVNSGLTLDSLPVAILLATVKDQFQR